MGLPINRSLQLLMLTSISGSLLMMCILHNKTAGNIRQHPVPAEHDAVKVFGRLNENYYANQLTPDTKTVSFNFSINPKNKCFWESDNMTTRKLVVVTVSKIDNFFTRYAIRRTWGSFDRKLGKLVFLVGTTENLDVQIQLLNEATLYNDIIQVNVMDAYHLLTYKSMAMLEWLYLFCRNADFYLKADDDSYINVNNIFNATSHIQEKRYFLCKVFEKGKPKRNETNKWAVPFEQFDGEFYPTYCSGTAYVFPSSILQDLYKSALTAKFCVMEDIYITGISAQNVNISHINNNMFLCFWTSKKDKIDRRITEYLSIHVVRTYDILSIHSMVMQGIPKPVGV